jgi:hypothetical protein
VFVSVTRLHLRSWRFFPSFALYTFRSTRQVKGSAGFLAGVLAGDARRGSWTITLWESDAQMRAFRNSGPHRQAMVRLLAWCDEASFVHWDTEHAALPTMEDAFQRLRDTGRTSKVYHPSAAHQAGRTVGDAVPQVGYTIRSFDRGKP